MNCFTYKGRFLSTMKAAAAPSNTSTATIIGTRMEVAVLPALVDAKPTSQVSPRNSVGHTHANLPPSSSLQ